MRLLATRLIVLVVGTVLVLTTIARLHQWQDERLLWTAAVRHAPNKPRPWNNLGRIYALNGGGALAEWAYRQAIARCLPATRGDDERHRQRAVAELNLAVLLAQRGNYLGALALADGILRREPRAPLTEAYYLTWLTFHQYGAPSSF